MMTAEKKREWEKIMMQEYVDMLAAQFGIPEDDNEAREILWNTVYGEGEAT